MTTGPATLRELLAALPGNRALVLSTSSPLRRDDTIVPDDVRRAISGARLGLRISGPAEALPILAALDGVAELILLISPAAAVEDVQRLRAECALDAIISDMPDLLRAEGAHAFVFPDLVSFSSSYRARPSPTTTRWVLTTSGTTGAAKAVAHTFSSLTRTSKTDAVRGAAVRWGMLYDYTRFAGLQVFLQSTLSGSLLIAPPLSDSLDRKLCFFATHGCTHLSGTPTMWRKMLMTPAASKLRLQQATLGGEIADDRVLEAVSRLYPAARVTHIFASTEAGVGFSVTDNRAGFPAHYLHRPPAGIELTIRDGRLFVRNPHVLPRYINSDAAFGDSDGWVDTGDMVEIVADRVLFRGRASGVINIGGDKIYPEEVERVLLAHPLVSMARVYSKPNPITGALVAADVILADAGADWDAARRELNGYAREQLGHVKAPAFIRIVRALESNVGGKITRG